MDALKRIGLAERAGRGIDRIFEGSLMYGRPLPDYTASTVNKVSVFISRSAPDEAFVSMVARENEKRTHPLPLQSLLVLDALKQCRRATAEELSHDIDASFAQLRQTLEADLLHVERNQAYYEIRKLVRAGRLTKAANGPKAYYTPV